MTTRSVRHSLFSPGKLMLLGEYAVLHGSPSIVAAVDRGVDLTWWVEPKRSLLVSTSLSDDVFQLLNMHGGVLRHVPPPGRLVRHVAAAIAAAGQSWRAATGQLHIDSSPMSDLASGKLGLGSSAAVAAGVARALCTDDVPRHLIARYALRGHHTYQGRVGSGSDVLASVHGGVIVVHDGEMVRAGRVDHPSIPGDHGDGAEDASPLHSALPPGIEMAAIYCGEAASTPAMVRALHAWSDTNVDTFESLISRMTRATWLGCAAIRDANDAAWMDAVAHFVAAERALAAASSVPIFTDAVDAAIDAAAAVGAVAKPSGAGGGDTVVVFHEGPLDRERLAFEAQRRGVHALDINVFNHPSADATGRASGPST